MLFNELLIDLVFTPNQKKQQFQGITCYGSCENVVTTVIDDVISPLERSTTMDFDLTEEQRIIQKTIRDFATKELAPIADELDEKEEFPD